MEKELLSDEIISLMEFRIQQEEHSSRIYEQMKLWFEDKGYLNLAKLYNKYVEDEVSHAGWAKSFLLDYGYNPKLKALPSPYAEYECAMDIFKATLDHELLVTKQCEELAMKALELRAPVLYELALKYCAEQREEINKAITVIDIAKLTTDMLVLDSYIEENYLED